MHIRFLTMLSILASTTSFAHGPRTIYLPIAGSVGNFRTDATVFNPSATIATTLTATFLPVCSLGGTAPSYQLTCSGSPLSSAIALQPRQMKVLNDVVATSFNGTGLGAISLAAPTEGVTFDATARIYASVADGSLGQFAQAVDSHGSWANGVLLQLEQNGIAGEKGTFRTNIGIVNPSSSSAATVTLTLHDAGGATAGTATIAMPPLGVLGPTNIAGLFNASGDLSEAWINFTADRALIVYASVIDNGTSDPTFIPAIADSGVTTE